MCWRAPWALAGATMQAQTVCSPTTCDSGRLAVAPSGLSIAEGGACKPALHAPEPCRTDLPLPLFG
jgi:hypothetical protein